MDNPDRELTAIQQCQNGDLSAFGVLYDLYARRIYNFIYYRTGHKETAEDLTSVVFTKALQKIRTFKGSEGLFSGWLFRIARNTVIDHHRTAKPTLDLEAAAHARARDDLAAEAELKDRLEQVKKYLHELTDDQREIVTMRLWDQLSYAEISALTGKTEGNCKVIFSRALQKMQKELVPILLYALFIIYQTI